VARNFLATERDQLYLMPPSIDEWLPDDHLAWFVLEAVEQFELDTFYARYRDDGWGRPAYDPKLLAALLLYAYCCGERSSRKIERRCTEDVAFRVVAANHAPDHATISRFRATHADALSGLFTDVLRLCAEAGLVSVGLVAIDGTKIAANASPLKTVDATTIAAQVERILAEAEAVDAAEDELYGDARGDELPEAMRTRAGRVQRLRELKARLDAEDGAKRSEVDEHERLRIEAETTGQRPAGRPRKPRDPQQVKPARANTTDPDAKVMKTPSGFLLGYNAQAAVNEHQVILAAWVSDQASDAELFAPTLAAARDNLVAAELEQSIDVVVADAGYFSEANIRGETDADLYIATGKASGLNALPEGDADLGPLPRPRTNTIDVDAEIVRRRDVLERWEAGELTSEHAIAELGCSAPTAHQMRKAYRERGHVFRPVRFRGEAPRLTVKEWMTAKTTTATGRDLYRKRSTTVEPVFGQIKEAGRFRRFARRGRDACDAEWKFAATANNLLKAWRARQLVPVG